ncbi:TRAP transporter substrate-binding protein DctP [Solemya velum gill symbiont]|nr:TRAP transporter substrate-binding protein DctP [Solemya velum gill symbiont]OOY34108.1 C4-dicarboxylate ABC transporter substrate-binding protein [Solemya velum gill symbiont]OOY36763.1 C4-dicarboxylate ABC transporter substrate-binding protein [Solemya velum gill symbiont]OOY39400.1 C4-dicarboxylate ABC transporter substrate-binding protein [Solemya velum gill symbiont]OOY45910.1 C4-dicarboxylate ABC transporter substrate-binding protein [Solemya velum gill symbiont]OOY46235.1 C4-dicarbox
MKLSRILIASAIGVSFLAFEVQAATEWNVSLWGKRRAFTENVEKLAELVEQKTKGDFKLNISYGGLSKSKENLDGISIGAFEMAQFCSFYHKDKNPTITVTELPFSKNVSLARIAEIYQKVHEHPVVAKDLARWNATLLMPTPLPQYNIVSKTDALSSLDDFNGLRVRGPGGIMGVLSKLGAVKTGVPFSEVRQSMDSGVIDAASFAPHAHLATKTYKVGKWATTNLNLGSANCPVVVNTDALNALSDTNREALLGSVNEAIAFYVDNYDNNTTGAYEKAVTEEGLNKVTFSSEQTTKLNELAESVRNDWVTNNADKFDSQALFDFTAALFAEESKLAMKARDGNTKTK